MKIKLKLGGNSVYNYFWLAQLVFPHRLIEFAIFATFARCNIGLKMEKYVP